MIAVAASAVTPSTANATSVPYLKLHNPGGTATVDAVTFSPNGKLLATVDSRCVIRIWDISSGRLLSTLTALKLTGITSIAFSSNGRLLAGAGVTKDAYLWDTATGKLAATLSLPGLTPDIESVTFSPDSNVLAAGDNADGSSYLWNTATGALIAHADRTRERGGDRRGIRRPRRGTGR